MPSDVLSSTMAQYVPAALGQLTSGGAGLLGGFLNYKYNSWLADKQNQFNIDMWNRTNEYNSPQAQMQRFKEAGLNPNLIYGNGNTGNASSPPQMVVPQAPDFSKGMQEMAKAFNIENLRTLVANRKKAEAEAENAKTNSTRNERELFAEERFGARYTYDYLNGKWVVRPEDPYGQVTVVHPSSLYFNRILENNYNRAHLIPLKAQLYEPEIWMRNYDKKYYPVSYWIGQGTRAIHGASDVVSMFMPSKWAKPVFKHAPYQYKNPYKTPYIQPDYTELPF